MIPLKEIRSAAARIDGRIHRTPVLSSRVLGEMAGVDLTLKCELFQKTGSFKPRGALNKVLSLTNDERARGLITVSAGNHAQAVAWAAREVGVRAVVVMPSDAPQTKVAAVRGYGADIVFHEDRATLFEKLYEERDRRGATFVHPFDDAVVLAGAGTLGIEIMEQVPDADIVVVPVGGGGLLGGVASAVKQLQARARVVAVELEAGPGLTPALAAGAPIDVPRPKTLADGMTPPFVGALPLSIAQEAVDDVVLVSEAQLIEAMQLLMTRCKLFVEASGAAAVAALISGRINVTGARRAVAIVSGGNIDLTTVANVFGGMK